MWCGPRTPTRTLQVPGLGGSWGVWSPGWGGLRRPPPPSFPAQGSRGQGGGGRKAGPSPQHPVGVSSLKPEPPAAGPHPQAVGWVGAHLPPCGPLAPVPRSPAPQLPAQPTSARRVGQTSSLPPSSPLAPRSQPATQATALGIEAVHGQGGAEPGVQAGTQRTQAPGHHSQQAGLALDSRTAFPPPPWDMDPPGPGPHRVPSCPCSVPAP